MAVYVNNITVDTGSNFYRDFYLDNADGTPLDLTGYSGKSEVRKHPESVGAAATFTLSFVDRPNGRIRLSLDKYVTEKIKPGRYSYDVLFTDSSDKKSIVIEGMFNARPDYTPISSCLITNYANTFGAVSEDSGHDSGIGSGLTQTDIDNISNYGVVAFGHYDNSCTDLPGLTTKFQDSIYMQKIQNYLQMGGVVLYIGEYVNCGNTAAHNTRLGLLGTSIRLGSTTNSASTASLILSNNAAASFPNTWNHSATNLLEVNSGTGIYALGGDFTQTTVAYEKVGNGAIVVVADSNGSSKTPSEEHYAGFRALITAGGGGGTASSPGLDPAIINDDGIYDYYLLEYSVANTVGINTFVQDNALNTRTIVTSPNPQTISGYTGVSTVGYAFTTLFTPGSNGPEQIQAGVGTPTYLSHGGGWFYQNDNFSPSAIGNNRIVVGDPYGLDINGTITGVAGTNIGVAYAYDLNGTPLFEINAPDGFANEEFGGAVEIDSNKIIIADQWYSGIHTSQGAVYVFDINGNLENRITLSNPQEDDFWPTTMAADNGKIFTSDYNQNVYIHNLDGTGEIKITESSLTNTADGGFGDYSIAAGNNKFVVGAVESVYVFNQDGTGEIFIPDPTNGDSGYYGDQVAIGGNKIFVADPFWEDPEGNYAGAVYSYDLDGTNESRIVTETVEDSWFEGTYNTLLKQLVASEDYIWYGAQYGFDMSTGQFGDGIVYRWDIDGSNNIIIAPPIHSTSGYTSYGESLSVDKTSDRFIVGAGGNGYPEDVYMYSHNASTNPRRITNKFDRLTDFVLFNRSNFVSNHAGTGNVSLELRGGWNDSPAVSNDNGLVTVTVRGFDGGLMNRFGGSWVHSLNTTGATLGFTTSYVGYGATNENDLGTSIATLNIDITNGSVSFS